MTLAGWLAGEKPPMYMLYVHWWFFFSKMHVNTVTDAFSLRSNIMIYDIVNKHLYNIMMYDIVNMNL